MKSLFRSFASREGWQFELFRDVVGPVLSHAVACFVCWRLILIAGPELDCAAGFLFCLFCWLSVAKALGDANKAWLAEKIKEALLEEKFAVKALANAQVVSPSGWQPIETAPKDGTLLLLFATSRDHSNGATGVYQQIGSWDYVGHSDAIGAWYDRDEMQRIDATHWMKLPAPPTS